MHKMATLWPRLQCTWKNGTATWVGPLQPSALSEVYRVRIAYRVKERPRASVLSPPLKGRPDHPSIPHVYTGLEPCLFLPGSEEWSAEMHISDTIVPWTSLWIYYYELWYSTGEWLGGGVHPQSQSEKVRA